MNTNDRRYQITAECSAYNGVNWLKIIIGDWRSDTFIDLIYKLYDIAPDSLTLAEYYVLEDLAHALSDIQTEDN